MAAGHLSENALSDTIISTRSLVLLGFHGLLAGKIEPIVTQCGSDLLPV